MRWTCQTKEEEKKTNALTSFADESDKGEALPAL